MTMLTGRRVLVTGSSRGAGLAAARRLLDEEASVVLNSRDADALEALRLHLEARDRVRAMAFDVTDDDGTATAISWCVENWGALDAIIHAVPARIAIDPSALTQDSFEQALRLLLSATLNVARGASKVGVPRLIVLVPAESGYARKAVLSLVMSLASAWPATRVIAATEAELVGALARGVLCG